MNPSPQIRQYLLGDLSDEESARIEEEFFSSDERFAEIVDGEDALTEEFLRGELAAGERARFEARFLSTPRGRQKVALAATLAAASTPRAKGWPVSRMRLLAIAAVLLLLAIGVAAIQQFVLMRKRIDGLERQETALRNSLGKSEAEMHRLQAVNATPVFAMILGGSDLVRGAQPGSALGSTILLRQDPATVEAWLVLPPGSRDVPYAAAVRSVEGQPVWAAKALSARSIDGRLAVVARIPSEALHPGMFVISVRVDQPGDSGASVEDFSFSVKRP